VVSHTVRFLVSRSDVNLLFEELAQHHPDALVALYAPLLEALVAAAARLDTEASRRITGRTPMTELILADEHAKAFRQWLAGASERVQAADPVRARALMSIQRSAT
jgi:hypothetical protein